MGEFRGTGAEAGLAARTGAAFRGLTTRTDLPSAGGIEILTLATRGSTTETTLGILGAIAILIVFDGEVPTRA